MELVGLSPLSSRPAADWDHAQRAFSHGCVPKRNDEGMTTQPSESVERTTPSQPQSGKTRPGRTGTFQPGPSSLSHSRCVRPRLWRLTASYVTIRWQAIPNAGRAHPAGPQGSSGIAQPDTHRPRNEATARTVGTTDSLTNRQVLLSTGLELELKLVQTHMTQKPLLWVEGR